MRNSLTPSYAWVSNVGNEHVALRMRLLVLRAALFSHFKFYYLRLHNFGVISGRNVAKALPGIEGLFVLLVNSPLPCAVFSLEPLAQEWAG
jgi:hypothetical protein